jgi:hypothetical protein
MQLQRLRKLLLLLLQVRLPVVPSRRGALGLEVEGVGISLLIALRALEAMVLGHRFRTAAAAAVVVGDGRVRLLLQL